MKRLFYVLALIKAILSGSDIEWDWDANACPPGKFFATVGHFNATSKNFKQLLKSNPRLLVVVSSSACRECCPFEGILHTMIERYFTNSTLNHNITVKIARVDLVYEPWYLSTYPSATVPDVQYFRNGVEQSLTSKADGGLIMEQIVRLEHWFEELSSIESLFDFLDPRVDQLGYKRKRVLCVMPEPEMLAEFDRIAQSTYWRADIKYGLIKDPELLEKVSSADLKISKFDQKTRKKLNLSLKTFGIESLEANRVYLISYKNQLESLHKSYVYHPETDDALDYWYMYKSAEVVEEFNKQNQNFLTLRSPVTLFAFLDVADNTKTSWFIDEFEKLARTMPQQNFVWLDFDTSKKVAMSTGVFNCPERPCISLSIKQEDDKAPNESNVVLARNYDNYYLMPSHFSKTFAGMHEFISIALSGSSVLSPGLDLETQKAFANYRTFQQNFSLKTLSHSHFRDEVLKNNQDYIVFFVESYSDFDQQALFEQYYAIKNFFKKVRNMNPILFIYDFSSENSLRDFDLQALDTLVITRELKEDRKSGVICKKVLCTTAKVIVEYLKTKKTKLDKATPFSEEEKSIDITYQAIFEGQFNSD